MRLKSWIIDSDHHRRRAPREEVAAGTVAIDGTIYPVENWSQQSFLAKPCAADCNIGEIVDISFSVPLTEGRLEFDCGAVVTRANQDEQELAGVFVYMNAATEAAFAAHFANPATTRFDGV